MGMAGLTVALMMIGVIISPCVNGDELSDHKEIEVERLLKRLNKPALISIKSDDGDIIDCVPIQNQLAFDHPLLKNHTIQMRPSFIPESTSTYTKDITNVTQVWNKNGRCPENTVSIRRIKKEDILRSKSIQNFGKKMMTPAPGILLYGSSSVHEDLTSDPSKGHEYATMNSKGKYFGTECVVNIWKPYVQGSREFSLAQTWLVSGVGLSRNTIEAGFQVHPAQYGDFNLRLFVYWTADGYQHTGCHNTDCPGFVQISKRVTVGGTYKTVSQYNGAQYAFRIVIWRDRGNGKKWWLKVGDEVVGYWPSSLFTSLGDGATRVSWGGEIVNDMIGGKHTATDMGSGHFAEEDNKKASYFRNLMIVSDTNVMREPKEVHPIVTNANCYNIKAGRSGTSWGIYFYHGGPGRNAKCP
ncbi:uncharacterized protein LOC108836396 [Raphanus sativus]|uniref:Uncharacterized protein LOC108836396 n=1 Tax=Raphanus sativus TaxID=3726 RepID=A0A9W3BVX4_RAPSA|nr:uncharacterized protein LOC108836396 [Raphanus sativus]